MYYGNLLERGDKMKKYFSFLLALVLVVTAIPMGGIAATAASLSSGDANGDGAITAIDARIALQIAAGIREADDDLIEATDINGDGKVTAIDARYILIFATTGSYGEIAPPEETPDEPGDEPETPVIPETPPTNESDLHKVLALFGYMYDAEQNIYYTHLNPWQRYFGFTDLYDTAAAYALMEYMTLKIDFEYDGLLWRLQWWKGQYGVLEGAELGVYTKDPANADSVFYKCAADEHLLEMYFEYYKSSADYNKGEPLFTRYEQEHWWLTGFKFGVCNPERNVLKAVVIAWDSQMADGIEEGLKNVTDKNGNINGFVEYDKSNSDFQGNNFYTREILPDGRVMFTVVWKDAGYLNYGEPENPES